MGFDSLLYRIRKQETPRMEAIRAILLKMIYFDVPGLSVVMRPIYDALTIGRIVLRLLLEKFFYLPVFKARCFQCGKNLSLPHGVPFIDGHMRITVGSNVQLDGASFLSGHLLENPQLVIGNRTVVGYKTLISVQQSVRIGDDCMIAEGCMIFDNDGHPLSPYRRLRKEAIRCDEVKPVVIENNVWIGARSIILKGVRIGEGAVVGAQSLVVRDVPAYSIVRGAPAKTIITGLDRIFHRDIGSETHEN